MYQIDCHFIGEYRMNTVGGQHNKSERKNIVHFNNRRLLPYLAISLSLSNKFLALKKKYPPDKKNPRKIRMKLSLNQGGRQKEGIYLRGILRHFTRKVIIYENILKTKEKQYIDHINLCEFVLRINFVRHIFDLIYEKY